jgi:hypothetical protein
MISNILLPPHIAVESNQHTQNITPKTALQPASNTSPAKHPNGLLRPKPTHAAGCAGAKLPRSKNFPETTPSSG